MNNKRRERGLSQLDMVTIDLLTGLNGLTVTDIVDVKISSTFLREKAAQIRRSRASKSS